MADEKMPVLKIEMEGVATSFRYPYFSQGVQPTYEMPPPATLYGHICSALGYEVDPASFQMAFHFTYDVRWLDYEHTHLLIGEKAKLAPMERELLFRPRLTLYLDRPDWLQHFRQPRYAVVLGRSQDLMRYNRVEQVMVTRCESAYVEHTILPLTAYRDDLQYWTMVALPRFINGQRHVFWGQYAMLTRRQTINKPLFCDAESAPWRGSHLGIVWLSLVD